MYAPDMYCAPQLYCRSTQNPRSRGNIGPFEGLVGGARMTGNHLCAVDPSSTIACWHEALFSVGTHDPHIDRALSCCPDSTKSLPPRPYCVQPYPPTTAVHGHRTQRRTTTRKKYGRGASWGGGVAASEPERRHPYYSSVLAHTASTTVRYAIVSSSDAARILAPEAPCTPRHCVPLRITSPHRLVPLTCSPDL